MSSVSGIGVLVAAERVFDQGVDSDSATEAMIEVLEMVPDWIAAGGAERVRAELVNVVQRCGVEIVTDAFSRSELLDAIEE